MWEGGLLYCVIETVGLQIKRYSLEKTDRGLLYNLSNSVHEKAEDSRNEYQQDRGEGFLFILFVKKGDCRDNREDDHRSYVELYLAPEAREREREA